VKARLLLAVASIALASVARADLYKCVGKEGKTTYQAEPCEESAAEKRVRTPVGGGSAGAAGGSGLKDGWDDDKSGPIVSSCVRNAIPQAKRTYVAAGGDAAKLREADLGQRVEAQCACMMRRIMTTMSYADFSANPSEPLQRVSAEAAAGGQCKLDISGIGGR